MASAIIAEYVQRVLGRCGEVRNPKKVHLNRVKPVRQKTVLDFVTKYSLPSLIVSQKSQEDTCARISFLRNYRIYDSVLIQENTGQRKPAFWHTLRSTAPLIDLSYMFLKCFYHFQGCHRPKGIKQLCFHEKTNFVYK